MAGLNTRTGQRDMPAPSKYIPRVQAKAATQGYASVQGRLNQYQIGPPQRQPIQQSNGQSQSRSVQYSTGPSSATGVSPYTQTNVTPKASDVLGTGNVAGVQSENAMASFTNAFNNMMKQSFSYASQAAEVSSGLQRQNENARSQNVIDQGAASSNQGRITDREKAGRDAFINAQAYNERRMVANDASNLSRDQAEALKQYQLNQQDLERGNATKNLAATYAQTDAQIQAAQASADANKYAASQSARASMFGSLSASLSPQQGWKYW